MKEFKKNLKSAGEPELKKLLDEKRAALRAFRLSLTGSKVKNVREGRVIRRSVAVILTEVKARKAAVPVTAPVLATAKASK